MEYKTLANLAEAARSNCHGPGWPAVGARPIPKSGPSRGVQQRVVQAIQRRQRNGQPLLIRMNEAEGLFDQIGNNTFYLIHPEEIIADNFSMLVWGNPGGWNNPMAVRTPQILEKLKEALLAPEPAADRVESGVIRR